MNKPKEGQQVELLIDQGRDTGPKWIGGFVVDAVVSAEDRDYRVTCSGEGYYFRECAPECVRPLKSPQ